MRSFKIFAIFTITLLHGCDTTSRIPLEWEDIRLAGDAKRIVCHVREISELKHLQFFYGTSKRDSGTMITIRLIGNGFEMDLYNAEKQDEYRLSVYQMSPMEGTEQRARHTYSEFKQALAEPISEECYSRAPELI